MEPQRHLDDLDLVRTFVVLAEEGNLTRAASRLFRTQSALSRRLQLLEETLGERLFDRGKSGVVLTDAGRGLLVSARELLRAADRFRPGMASTGAVPAAPLRIACSDTVARYLLAPVLPRLLELHPDMELELQVSNTPQTVARVADSEVDLGFVLLPARHRLLEFRPIRSYRHMAAFPPGRAPRGKEVALAPLLENPLVLLDRGTRTRQLIDASLLAKGLFAARVTEVGNVSVQKALVRAGLGVGILPGYSREPSDGLVWREISGASERVLAACLSRDRQVRPEIASLLESLSA
ncbi:MAG: LysR family transcriptional regulator [Fibrobacteria bacterium]|nr:LysR family transcriptional regulator [Fibrobacteria bacterium]